MLKQNTHSPLPACVIIGAGAMGCLFAAMFARAGIQIQLLENNTHIISSAQGCIRIDRGNSTESIPLTITNDSSILSTAQLIFIFVKSYSTEALLKTVCPRIHPDSTVISLQNGLGNVEILSRFLNNKQLVYGSTTYGAANTGPCTILPGGDGTVILGGLDTAQVNLTEKVLTHCGIACEITHDPMKVIWHKAIINAAINPPAAILSMTNGQLIANTSCVLLQKKIIHEAVLSAAAEGYNFDETDLNRTIREVCQKTAHNRCSMLQDISAGRKTEIDAINGYLVKSAAEKSLSLPVNETMCALIQALEIKALEIKGEPKRR